VKEENYNGRRCFPVLLDPDSHTYKVAVLCGNPHTKNKLDMFKRLITIHERYGCTHTHTHTHAICRINQTVVKVVIVGESAIV